MKCSDLDTIIIFALFLTIIGDALGLFGALLSQRCTKAEKVESEKEKNALDTKLKNLEQRIVRLEQT